MSGRMKKEKTKKVSFAGFVEEIELEDGKMGLQIDNGDDSYLIVMDEIGRQLQAYIDQEIDLTGVIRQTANDITLKINTFRLTEDDDDDYDDRYGESDDRYSRIDDDDDYDDRYDEDDDRYANKDDDDR